MPHFNKAKIVCTLGPATATGEKIRELIRAGMDVARLNFSHGDHESHKRSIELIRAAARELNWPVAILQDLSGPKIRVGEIPGRGMELRRGGGLILTEEKGDMSAGRVSLNQKGIVKDILSGQRILLADGTIELKVVKKRPGELVCSVITGGLLTSHKGVNAPQSRLSMPSLTAKDKDDLEFGIAQGVDFAALSFVRKPEDIQAVRRILEKHNSTIPIIAKIEKSEAIENLDSILDAADGVMIARGDLGVEIPIQRVAVEQKRIIRAANARGKPVITATQMLRSMVDNPGPTRAEVSDVANAIYDGTDAVMLSEETATGKYPVQAVRIMSRICIEAEDDLPYEKLLDAQWDRSTASVSNAIGHAVGALAHDLGLDAIICCTHSGSTARLISRHRPRAPIIAATPVPATLRQLVLVWGVFPVPIQRVLDTDDMIKKALAAAKGTGLVKRNAKVVITAGVPIGVSGSTNLIKVESIP